MRRRTSLTVCAAGIPTLVTGTRRARAQAPNFELSYTAGGLDAAGVFAGGTELRVLTAHGGKLYAGNGYWEDPPGPGRPGAQILVLDAPGGAWRVDTTFAERMANGASRDLAVGALIDVTFATDGSGRPLPQPVSLLLASTWDLTGASRVFTRHDDNVRWTAITLAQDRPRPNFLPQIRSFGSHRDRVTGVDLVFAGQAPRGIFAGHYDPAAPAGVRWARAPELGVSDAATFSGLELRVSSFAEANGRLYAAVGQQVFVRTDGPAPHWRVVYTNSQPGHSETGLRGLTALSAGQHQSLLATVEGSAARIVRIDPDTGAEVTELDLRRFLGRAWGMPVSYMIAGYNDIAFVHTPVGEVGLIGLMTFIPKDARITPGHNVVNVGYGQVEGGAWYLVRRADGHYDLKRVTAGFPQSPVAVRTIRPSPFAAEPDAVYFGGYDANKAPAHNTAWIARTTQAW